MAQQSHFIYKNDQSNYKAARNGNRLNELTGSAFQSSIFTNISGKHVGPEKYHLKRDLLRESARTKQWV
ncbi:hypothetical protein RIR_jg4012.t1 [Rhizophagus irregularis DAOM 181602=DAOM 197198]|nr:hypothetical protein RIR_jg4012.t1 [Rhizophagus irregularis DAOM 181602=DAOM 197198]CAB5164421.1 unnamed protein product [Rhizophagus irregularis]CAB5385982.1 unnamed protein product [Rhizophagus irregularis]